MNALYGINANRVGINFYLTGMSKHSTDWSLNKRNAYKFLSHSLATQTMIKIAREETDLTIEFTVVKL